MEFLLGLQHRAVGSTKVNVRDESLPARVSVFHTDMSNHKISYTLVSAIGQYDPYSMRKALDRGGKLFLTGVFGRVSGIFTGPCRSIEEEWHLSKRSLSKGSIEGSIR